MKRILMITIIIAMFISACGNCPNSIKESASVSHAEIQNLSVNASGKLYNLVPCDTPQDTVAGFSFQDDIYYITEGHSGETTLKKNNDVIYSLSGIYYAASVSANGIWILENNFYGGESHYALNLISSVGKDLKQIDVSQLYSESSIERFLICTNTDLYLICSNNMAIVINESGELKDSFALPDNSYFVRGNDDKVYIIHKTDISNEIYSINKASSNLSRPILCDAGVVYSGGKQYFLILYTEDGLYGIDCFGTKSPIALWEECAIFIDTPYDIQEIGNKYLFKTEAGLSLLSPSNSEGKNNKEQLTIATIGSSHTLSLSVANFNQNNDNYYVTISNYLDGTDSIDTAYTKLNTDIISGNLPDMICFTSISPFPYISHGLMLNLNGKIEADIEIDPQDITILNALYEDDNVYFLCPYYTAETLVARFSEFGDRTGWTLSEYLEIESRESTDTITIYNMTKKDFLYRVASRYIRNAIDWTHGTCKFDCDEFIEILEAANRIQDNPENQNDMIFGYGPSLVGSGTLVTSLTWIDNVSKLAFDERMAGCKLSYIGWPTVDGSCGTDVYLVDPVGIVAKSQHVDGCWEFIKFCLQNANTNHDALPVYRPLLYRQIDEKNKSDDEIEHMTESDIESFFHLISSIQNIAMYDETVMDIIIKESQAFFSGNRTAQEVAQLIQTKVGLYLSERI